jgi:hypothetical protein
VLVEVFLRVRIPLLPYKKLASLLTRSQGLAQCQCLSARKTLVAKE